MQRVKGQEVEIIVIQNGTPLSVLSAVRSCSITYQLETKSEGYLGETTNRVDSVFNGMAGRMEMHFSDPSMFQVVEAAVNKARRRVPGITFNMKMVFNFPSGRRARVIVPDIEWGDFEVNAGSRTDYVGASTSWVASQALSLI